MEFFYYDFISSNLRIREICIHLSLAMLFPQLLSAVSSLVPEGGQAMSQAADLWGKGATGHADFSAWQDSEAKRKETSRGLFRATGPSQPRPLFN